MADNETLEEEDGQNADIKNLRRAAKERDDLQKQLADRDRELAFAKAKLDLDDPKLRYFIKGYEGELTPDAIRTQAQADGFLPAPPPPDQSEMNAHQRVQHASSGAGDAPPPDLNDQIRQAQSQEEVMELVMKNNLPTSWNRPE